MKRIVLYVFLACALTMALMVGCGSPAEEGPLDPVPYEAAVDEEPPADETIAEEPEVIETPDDEDLAVAETSTEQTGEITLATTTSTEDSGLLDFILPVFIEETGWEIRVISVGTGAALQMGRDGEADVLLVHARAEEDRFVDEGYAERRHDVMYNDFVIVGPSDGPIAHNDDILETFTYIAEQNLPFVSRGDDSGTHMRELQIWESLGITPEDNTAYASVGQGMGATLGMTAEMDAFTLSDRATWLAYPDVGNLVIVCEGSDLLLNPYGVMVVSTTEHPEGAQTFIDWITSGSTQQLISTFGVEEFGQPLFFPDA